MFSVPAYFEARERQALRDTARIANLGPAVQIMTEGAAITLFYAYQWRSCLNDEKPLKIVFIDIGHSHTTCTLSILHSGHAEIIV